MAHAAPIDPSRSLLPLFTRALGACLLLVGLAAAPATAETSGSLVLRGFIPTRCNIEVGTTPVASALPLAQAQQNVVVASVRETCNAASGYTVEVSSRHDGQLEGASASVAYRFQYGDVAANLAGSRSEPVKLVARAGRTSDTGIQRTVRISHDGAASVPGGSYEDTLVFTIRAK